MFLGLIWIQIMFLIRSLLFKKVGFRMLLHFFTI